MFDTAQQLQFIPKAVRKHLNTMINLKRHLQAVLFTYNRKV